MIPQSSLAFDHLAVACRTLAEGVDHIEKNLGVIMPPGGAHPAMGTHNRLMALNECEFLEAIAVNPEADAPSRTRWFGLDTFDAAARLGTWVVGTRDIDTSLALLTARLPDVDLGKPTRITRGDLSWLITIRDDGSMPFDGAFPALIQWPVGQHPAARMIDMGCSLASMTIEHPEGARIADALQGLLDDRRFVILTGSACRMRAEIASPTGIRVLF
ncbi:VOC family protein [Sulfitobacter sp. JB4-11]|uniref:VOC family protein n=1 Tax=Sulfitobacter rhodophyticola TaxID=3238304 RepID=UPI0035169FC9